MDGLQQFVETLGSIGSEGLSLPQETTGLILREARDRGWSFDDAWAAAINRLQPSSVGGSVDPVLAADLHETRTILEECRPHFEAAYHGRQPALQERAIETASAWGRLEGPVPGHYYAGIMRIRSRLNGYARS